MKRYHGFTLIESIMVIILLGIIAVIASLMMNTGFIAYLSNKNIMDANWQGRIAIERMARDIREIRSSTDISTASASQIIFVDTNNNTTNYQLSGSSLLLNGQVIADGVASLTLSYFDKNGASTGVTNLIRFITITLNVTLNNATYVLTTAVNPRNVK